MLKSLKTPLKWWPTCYERVYSTNVFTKMLAKWHMFVLQITNGDGIDKTAFWVDAGIHAREWIAPATATYFIDRVRAVPL